jgi:hypothetical protein
VVILTQAAHVNWISLMKTNNQQIKIILQLAGVEFDTSSFKER